LLGQTDNHTPISKCYFQPGLALQNCNFVAEIAQDNNKTAGISTNTILLGYDEEKTYITLFLDHQIIILE